MPLDQFHPSFTIKKTPNKLDDWLHLTTHDDAHFMAVVLYLPWCLVYKNEHTNTAHIIPSKSSPV